MIKTRANVPLVSVAMVVCNVDRYLTASIESLLGQTFRDFEFIIVDFGSTDASKSIITSYATKDERVKFHEIPNCALPAARNASCRLALGKYIAIMDADDICLPDRLKLEVEFMEAHPEVGLVGGAAEWIDATGKSMHFDFPPTLNRDIRSALALGCPFRHATALMRKEAFNLCGGYRSAFLQAEDYDLWLRVIEDYDCANLGQVVLKYRVHPHQISIRKQQQQTLCVLAAQTSAMARKNGASDPLNLMGEITPEALVALGVTEITQQRVLAANCVRWIRNMYMAGESSAALEAGIEMLQSEWDRAESWRIADLHLLMARLYWQRKDYLRSVFSAGRAVATRPLIIGRPLKPLLRSLQLGRSNRQTEASGADVTQV